MTTRPRGPQSIIAKDILGWCRLIELFARITKWGLVIVAIILSLDNVEKWPWFTTMFFASIGFVVFDRLSKEFDELYVDFLAYAGAMEEVFKKHGRTLP